MYPSELNTPVHSSRGTADFVPSRESKIAHNAPVPGRGEPEHVSAAPRAPSSALRNRVFDSTRPRTRARLPGHPGAGATIWNLEKLFPGKAAGIAPAAFLLGTSRSFCWATKCAAQRRSRCVRRAWNSVHGRRTTEFPQATLQTAMDGAIGPSFPDPAKCEKRPASVPAAGVIFEQKPRTDTQRRDDQRYHQKRG
jgi:hypothetical protein